MTYISRVQAGLALITRSVEAMLCTVGPAGLQASYVSCSVYDLDIYVYIPRSSDQFDNLEFATEVILMTPVWQLRGVGAVMSDEALQAGRVPLALMGDADRLGLAIAMITPHRMQIDLVEKINQRETIDFDAKS